jgi:hypothetical protein
MIAGGDRPRCVVCGGPVYQPYADAPFQHVNLERDWAPSPHEAVVDDPEDGSGR